MQKVLLDTDIGGDIDDAVCLAYLLRAVSYTHLGDRKVGGKGISRSM